MHAMAYTTEMKSRGTPPRNMSRQASLAFLQKLVGLPCTEETSDGVPSSHSLVIYQKSDERTLTVHRTPPVIRQLKDEGIIGVT